jgi:hypothetical protein
MISTQITIGVWEEGMCEGSTGWHIVSMEGKNWTLLHSRSKTNQLKKEIAGGGDGELGTHMECGGKREGKINNRI